MMLVLDTYLVAITYAVISTKDRLAILSCICSQQMEHNWFGG